MKKKRVILFLLIGLSFFAYYKYTKMRRERLIKTRIAEIQKMDQDKLASILRRVEKVKKRIRTGLLKPKRLEVKRHFKKKTPSFVDESDDEDDDDIDEDIDDEDDDDDEDEDNMKPVATPRGRLKPLSPSALKKIREAAKERMQELLRRREREENGEEDDE